MRLSLISESLSHREILRLLRIARKDGDWNKLKSSLGLENDQEVWDIVGKYSTDIDISGTANDLDVESKSLRYLIKMIPKNSIRTKILNFVVNNIKQGNISNISDVNNKDLAEKYVKNGKKLAAWIPANPINYDKELIYTPAVNAVGVTDYLITTNDNVDVAEYIISFKIDSTIRDILQGLAFGYPPSRVLQWVREVQR